MKRLLLLSLLLCSVAVNNALAKNSVFLKNDLVEVEVDNNGNLTKLVNLKTGHNYASGCYLWRMFYDTHAEREIQILPEQQKAQVSCDGNSIVIFYKKLTDVNGEKLDMPLTLTITIQGDEIHFASAMENNVEHSVIREM
ncbi:MAG: hypothetical protein IJD27_05945, partial [Alistipes sp.]|nr:hypothetical protein [Alistipes sp.]